MYDKIDCKIEIASAPYFRFIDTYFKAIVFIYRHWCTRINNYAVREVHRNDLEDTSFVEITLTLNTNGSSTDLSSIANQAGKIRKMDCVQGIILKPRNQS